MSLGVRFCWDCKKIRHLFVAALKAFFYFLGLQVVSKRHRLTMEQALTHVREKGFYPEVVIDVGVGRGTSFLTNVFPLSRYVWIEPLKEFQPTLEKLTKSYKGNYILACAGVCEGETIVNVHEYNLTTSSVYKEMDGSVADGYQRKVQVITLDSLINRYKLKGQSVLLKIDVQGAEIDVLRGAKNLLEMTEVIILEVSFFELFKGSPQAVEVFAFMASINFVPYDIVDGVYRPLDNALAQKDVVFVKENGLFRGSHRYASDAQRSSIVNQRDINLP